MARRRLWVSPIAWWRVPRRGGGRRSGWPVGRARLRAAWPSWGLQTKVSALLALTVAVAILVVGLVMGREGDAALRAEAQRQAQATAALAARIAQYHFASARDRLSDLAQKPTLLEAVATNDAETVAALLHRYGPRQDPMIGSVHWVDAAGVLRASTSPTAPLGQNVAGQLWFFAARSVLEARIGTPLANGPADRAIVPVSVALRDPDGTFLGLLVGPLDLAALTDSLALAAVRPSQRVLLVDTRTDIIGGSTRPDDLLQPVATLGLTTDWRQLPPATVVAVGTPPTEQLLIGQAPVAGLPWVVLVVEPYDAALGVLQVLLQRGGELLLVVVLVAALAGWLLGRSLVQPLVELRTAARRVAAGELGYMVPVHSRDELGQVASSFNTMSAALARAYARSRAAAQREALLNRINARVRASLDVDAVLRTTVEELGAALGAGRCCLHLVRGEELQAYAYEWTRPGVASLRDVQPCLLPLSRLAGRERRPIVIPDLDAAPGLVDPALGPHPDWRAIGIRALLVTPLFMNDELLGTICVHETTGPRAWTADDIALVEGVAGEAAMALTNARLYAEAERRAERLAAVTRINRAISARLDLVRLIEVVGEALGQLVPFDRLSLVRFEPDGQHYRVLGAIWRVPPVWEPAPLNPMAGTPIEIVYRERRALIRHDFANPPPDLPLSVRERQMLAGGLRSQVIVPILAPPEAPEASPAVLGAVALVGREPRQYGPEDVALLEPIADQLAVALQNADLYSEVVASQRRLATIIAGIAEGVLVLDETGRVALWNAAAERLLGLPAAEALGQPWQAALRGADAAGRPLADAASALAQAIATGRAATLEVRAEPAPGQACWLSVSLAPVCVDQGQHLALTCRDVSAYKAVEQLKSDFVATVSHELRTPLASIKGYAATLRQRHDQLPAATQEEYLTIINEEADRLNALVGELLDVARLERGTASIACQPVALAPLVARAVELARVRTDRHTFVVDVPAELRVLAAPDRLEQVLTNLLDNARKYSPQGGAIRVAAAPAPLDAVTVTVTDEGIGIPPERQAELFRPFARVENVLTRQTEGAGLGLYICRQLVERMGGHISLHSAPGAGTTVIVTLRAAVPLAGEPLPTVGPAAEVRLA
ncbi:MAG: GAF domain-containing protein [Chloroflexi bacterium]|nr:GAF domain-containing protein [Chloroflexota bacterium]